MSNDPILAEVVGPDRSNSSQFNPPPVRPPQNVGCSTRGCLLALLVVLLGIGLVAGGGGWWLTSVISRQQTQRKEEQARLAAQDAAAPERSAELIAGFTADDAGVSAAELAELQSLFDAAQTASEAKASNPAFKRFFDLDTYTKRILAWPETDALNFLERQVISHGDTETEILTWLTGKFHIVRVEKQSDGKSAYVYGYVGMETNQASEQRWFLVHNGSQWKLADLEPCEFGRWHSQLRARHFKFGYRHPLSFQLFVNRIEQIDSAWSAFERGDYEEGRRQLERVTLDGIDPELHDELRMRLMHGWTYLYGSKEHARIAQEFDQPDQWPGAYVARAELAAQRRDWTAALEAAEQYQARVGPTIQICEVLLQAYDAFERDDERREIYRRLLRTNPSNVQWITGLADVAEAKEVVRHLESLAEPTATASQALQYLDHDLHPELVQSIIDLVARESPGSPELLSVRAQAAQRQGDYEAAADMYLAAWIAKPRGEDISTLSYGYHSAMGQADKLREAIAKSPDPLETLQFIAGDYVDEQVYVANRKLVEIALERCRSAGITDPYVDYYEASLLQEKNEYAQAEQHFQAALARFSDDSELLDRNSIVSGLAQVQLSQGRVAEAYATATAEQENGFANLISSLSLKEKDDQEKARQLTALHRSANPQDPWCDVMEAELLEQQQEYDQAWSKLPRTIPPDDYLLQYRPRAVRARLLVEGKVPFSQYGPYAHDVNLFSQVAQQLSAKKDWRRLNEFLDIQERANPEPKELLDWRAELLFQEQNYSGVVELLQSHAAELKERHGTRSYVREANAWDRLQRSLMKLQQYELVVANAQNSTSSAGDVDDRWGIWADLARGQIAEAVAAVTNRVDRFNLQTIYHDEDFGKLANAPEALPLRRQMPPNLPVDYYWQQIEVLRSSQELLDETRLKTIVEQVLGENTEVVKVVALKSTHDIQVWRVKNSANQFFICSGKRFDKTDEEAEQFADADLQQAYDIYQTWIAVVPLGLKGMEETPASALQIAGHFAEDSCLAIRIGGENQSLVCSPELVESLKAGKLEKRLDDEEYNYTVSIMEAQNVYPQEQTSKDFWRKWATFTKHLKQGTAEEAKVCLRLKVCGSYEDVWLTAEQVQGRPGRYCELVASTSEPAELLSDVRLAEPYAVSSHSIHDFVYTHEGVAIRGRE